MSVEHSVIDDPNIHEPKGVSAANAGEVYVADGAGSGSWEIPGELDVFGGGLQYIFTYTFIDIGTVGSQFLAFPFDCTINKIYGALSAAITTTNTILTFANQADASMGTMTIAFSASAAGDVDLTTPASNNTFAIGERIKITTDGATDATGVNETLTFLVTRTDD